MWRMTNTQQKSNIIKLKLETYILQPMQPVYTNYTYREKELAWVVRICLSHLLFSVFCCSVKLCRPFLRGNFKLKLTIGYEKSRRQAGQAMISSTGWSPDSGVLVKNMKYVAYILKWFTRISTAIFLHLLSQPTKTNTKVSKVRYKSLLDYIYYRLESK